MSSKTQAIREQVRKPLDVEGIKLYLSTDKNHMKKNNTNTSFSITVYNSNVT